MNFQGIAATTLLATVGFSSVVYAASSEHFQTLQQTGDCIRCDLRGAPLSQANLSGANLKGADLQNADLRGANLRGANLELVNLSGANLEGANLQGAKLDGALLNGVNFCRATVPQRYRSLRICRRT